MMRLWTRHVGTLYLDAVHYHRNGCGGSGFYVVAFRQREGRMWTPLVATLEVADDGPDPPTCRVLNLADLSQAYYGDDLYGPPLRAWLRTHPDAGFSDRMASMVAQPPPADL